MTYGLRTTKVLDEVGDERGRQIEKWGDQSHRDGTGPEYEIRAANAKAECQATEGDGDRWSLILLEEVYEALVETDPAKLRAELIQAAAVATAWVEDIDRRGSS